MINFVIVDDNNMQRKKLNKIIFSKMMNNKIDFNILEFDDYNNKLIKYIDKNESDTVYVIDLELPSGDGIDIARYIRYELNNWISPIIIITAHTSLYYEVYKQRLQVLDFIGKCECIEKNLSENIDICLKMLSKEKYYKYTYKGIDYSINFNSIDYVQRDGRQTKIVTKEKEYYQNISICEIKKLFPNYFKLSSKGILINCKNVDNINWNDLTVTFKDGINEYLVSKNHKKELALYDID